MTLARYISSRRYAKAFLIVHSPLRLLVLRSLCDGPQLAARLSVGFQCSQTDGQHSFLFLHFNVCLEKFERKPPNLRPPCCFRGRERAAVNTYRPKEKRARWLTEGAHLRQQEALLFWPERNSCASCAVRCTASPSRQRAFNSKLAVSARQDCSEEFIADARWEGSAFPSKFGQGKH